MTRLIAALLAVLTPSMLFAQSVPPQGSPEGQAVQKLFEAGRYQQVVDAVAPSSPPDAAYLAAQSYQKMGARDQAIQAYAGLASLPSTSAWHFIGLSGRQLIEDQFEPSVASARQAVATAEQGGAAPSSPGAAELAAAQYQLGLSLAKLERWPDAAAAFEAATGQQPAFAYAHYYGGLMYSRANRTDQMAIHFDLFLKLAPEAPERPEVLSIMRTIRRR